MKHLILFFLGIIFLIFLSSSIILDTPWFSKYLLSFKNDSYLFIYLEKIKFFTSLILTSFLIAYANYSIKIYGKNIKNKVIMSFGLFFSILIVGNLLISHYDAEYVTKLDLPLNVKAKNSRINASDMYYRHGILIEYYDYKGLKQKFKPSIEDTKIKELKDILTNKQNMIPIYIVISFLMLIMAYFMSNKLVNKHST